MSFGSILSVVSTTGAVEVHLLGDSTAMYQSNRSLNIPPPGLPRAFDVSSCPGGREFDELSLSRGGAFNHYSQGVGNLITSLDFMLRVVLIPRGVINHGDQP